MALFLRWHLGEYILIINLLHTQRVIGIGDLRKELTEFRIHELIIISLILFIFPNEIKSLRCVYDWRLLPFIENMRILMDQCFIIRSPLRDSHVDLIFGTEEAWILIITKGVLIRCRRLEFLDLLSTFFEHLLHLLVWDKTFNYIRSEYFCSCSNTLTAFSERSLILWLGLQPRSRLRLFILLNLPITLFSWTWITLITLK